jgi:hypothetical protein
MPSSNMESSDYQPKLDELISLRQAAKMSGLSPNHLRLLVGKGEIWGKKIDHYWVTTEKAVREYLARDIRPGPKPKRKS